MAAFCHFWRIPPSEYWSLTVAEASAMSAYANEVMEAGSPDG